MLINKVTANGSDEIRLLAALKNRSGETDRKVTAAVSEIIEAVRLRGDEAVREFSLRFDGWAPPAFEVDREEINDALTAADPDFVEALLAAQENIVAFHQRQKRQSFVDTRPDGVILGQRVRGLDRVGIYVPGGTAAYPSTVLMDSIPAKIAGCPELIMVTPPGKDGKVNAAILTAARIAGVDRIFKLGGAQAVAALAYGTESVPAVDKIVGPGNAFVAEAKRQVFGKVAIDMIAGPSEILIVADGTCEPAVVAADMLSAQDGLKKGI